MVCFSSVRRNKDLSILLDEAVKKPTPITKGAGRMQANIIMAVRKQTGEGKTRKVGNPWDVRTDRRMAIRF